jgi:hypothetical protein
MTEEELQHLQENQMTQEDIMRNILNGETVIAEILERPDHSHITDCAKDLIKSLIKKDPLERLSATEAL